MSNLLLSTFLLILQIVHRDLAARNVLVNCLDKRIVAKISDFGLARQLDDSNAVCYTEREVRCSYGEDGGM